MDLPDAEDGRDRGLPMGEVPSPPVRLYIASELCRDPEYDGSLEAPVTIQRRESGMLPTSSGILSTDVECPPVAPHLTILGPIQHLGNLRLFCLQTKVSARQLNYI